MARQRHRLDHDDDDDDDDSQIEERPRARAGAYPLPVLALVSGSTMFVVGAMITAFFWLIYEPDSMILSRLNTRQNSVMVGCALMVCGSILFASRTAQGVTSKP